MGVGSSQLLPERDGRWHRWREDGKMRKGLWRPITSSQYALAFQQFGGSFAVHPDVVSLVSDFAARPVDYRGLFHGPDLVAALPLWGRHVVGAAWTLARYRVADQFDGGDPELILPIAPDVQIHLPCCARYISPLQQPRITNLAPESTALTIAREMGAGTAPLPSRGLRQRRRRLPPWRRLSWPRHSCIFIAPGGAARRSARSGWAKRFGGWAICWRAMC
jgi:hypothetical protein